MELVLTRNSHGRFGTFSKLQAGDLSLVAVEQDWENNEPYKSCIPNGTYELLPYSSPKHGDCYVMVNHDLNVGKYKGESKRFACLIHIANKASQVEGCIAVGSALGMVGGEWAVTGSGHAMAKLKRLLKKDSHTLVIQSGFPDFKEV